MAVKAESVHLQLPPEDQKRLDESPTLRKEEGLWEYRRRSQSPYRKTTTEVVRPAFQRAAVSRTSRPRWRSAASTR